MAIQDTELIDDLLTFLNRYYRDEMGELANKYPKEQTALEIEWRDLFRFNNAIADDLHNHPREIINALEDAVSRYDLPIDKDLSGADVHVTNPPESFTFDVGEYRSNNIGEWIGVSGQVSKQTDVRPRPVETAYECQRCGTLTRIPQLDDELQEPHECQGCERQGPFRLNMEQTEWVDHQKLRIQLPPEKSKGGDGTTIDTHIEGDLVGEVDAGDRVTVSGIMSVVEGNEKELAFEPQLDGVGIDIEETDYEDINMEEHLDEIHAIVSGERGDPYELLIDSLAPKIIGMDTIKEAIGLQMFGGVRAHYPDGTTDRGDIHMLLLGDPGTAKSKLLTDAEQKAPRSTFASGKGASKAGMTAAAVRDDFGPQEWTLDAGALVLADRGLACVDEIDKVDEDAISSMHEALSKQQVHINKAGINTHLPTRTSLLAAGNPKYGRFDQTKPVGEQIELGPTIMSRFDLMFMVEDQPDAEDDREVIEGMIEGRQAAVRYSDDGDQVDDDVLADVEPAVETEVLRAWIAHARQEVMPKIEDKAVAEELKDSFAKLRMMNGDADDAPVPVTFRKLEGLQRLAEASARVRLSEEIEMQDIDRARRLVGRAMRDVGMDPDTGSMDADVIETGTPKSQQERMDWVKQQIASNHLDYDSGYPLSDLIEDAEEAGIGENTARYAVKKLKNKGEIYDPDSEDCYRPVN